MTSTPDWVCLIALALTGMVLFNVAVVEAVDTGEPAVVGTVVGLAPVGVGLLVPAVERRRPRAAIVAGAILASSGAALVQGFGDADRAALCWSGVALCCEVAFTVLAAPLLRTLSPLGLAIRACALASVMLLVAATLLEGSDGFVRPDAGEGLAIGYLAVASTSVAFVLWYCALARLGPERTACSRGSCPSAPRWSAPPSPPPRCGRAPSSARSSPGPESPWVWGPGAPATRRAFSRQRGSRVGQ